MEDGDLPNLDHLVNLTQQKSFITNKDEFQATKTCNHDNSRTPIEKQFWELANSKFMAPMVSDNNL